MINAIAGFSLLRLFARQSFARMLAYRLTATFTVVFGTFFAAAEVVSLLIYFRFTDNIAGWDFYSFLALVATFSFIQYMYQFFFVVAHEDLIDKIIEGELDYDLIRPIDSQLLCSLKNLDYPSLVNMIIPVGLLIYCWPHLKVPFSVLSLGVYIVLVLLGVAFYYLLNQVFFGLSFWIERPTKLSGVPEYLFEFATRPRAVYPRFLQVLLAIVLPVVAASNTPVDVLRGKFDPLSFIALIIAAILLALIARWQWLAGVRRYASTS